MEPVLSVQDRMHALVARIDRTFSSESSWVRAAFLKVPRHRFIRRREAASPEAFTPVDRDHPTEEDFDLIYADQVVMIHHPPSSASQPFVVAKMLEWLELKPGMKVLEIGTGSGFNAALLAEGTGDPKLVYTIDIQEDLVAEAKEHLIEAGCAGVNVLCGDGGYGWAEAGPFDRIIVTAGSGDIPPAWLEQLAEGGVLVMPFATPPLGDLQLRLRKNDGIVRGEYLAVFFFMSLQGLYHVPVPATARRGGSMDHTMQAALRSKPGYTCGMSWMGRLSFWLFTRGQIEWFARLAERWTLVGTHGRAVMADFGAGLYVDYDERGMFNAHGRPGPVWNFGALLERWKAHGWPAITDYEVTVEPDPGVQPGPGEWIDRRPSVALRVRVREGNKGSG